MRTILIPVLFLLTFSSFSQKTNADLLFYNGTIYTVDPAFSVKEAMVIKDGKILATGNKAELEKKFFPKERINLKGKYVYPGFIDAHAHFDDYGKILQTVNLIGTKSWQDVLKLTKEFVIDNDIPPGTWIEGRGWDQNDWDHKEFPQKTSLDSLFPDNPIILTRVDGHAAIANRVALDKAAIRPGDRYIGGDAETRSGELTGILIDNAINAVSSVIPAPTYEELKKRFLKAEKNCFAVGLTTITDCGQDYKIIEQIKKLQENGDLRMRLYVMLSDSDANYNYLEKRGIIKTDRLHVRGFKIYGDGALGSRGACLLEPYSDRPGHHGFLLSNPDHFDSVAGRIIKNGFQMCSHAIGDSGNRMILKIYAKYLKGKNDLRWRIEHAQVINKNDFTLFGRYSIIPSVQPTHATSDMYWAGDRLGNEREKVAYAFKDLLNQNGWIPLGTDFPVEDISPLRTFYAAVVRKDLKGWPAKGYQVENALSRKETLKGMTVWAAKANFEEKEKGSLEKGKFADFVILDNDLMKVSPNDIINIKVLATYLGGQKVYEINQQ